ncbi:MAG: hypothetical protein NWF06_00765 [Candidatus Bathyarchaeota archaeon]|nr:hypothetical protein [Candidatus Bathyarchaeum sp.]
MTGEFVSSLEFKRIAQCCPVAAILLEQMFVRLDVLEAEIKRLNTERMNRVNVHCVT